ncbi:Maf family protein [Desulfobotulus sp.]|uniref:Maf family protein n=1 Tax=Desulfobotulus sp. TaxID=1940337 RepID=UPI002A361897|nr:Maf family protein [Desulfobotulus sp.]MDY0161753.1 Maf family protein [Desulfobotulus sp.]
MRPSHPPELILASQSPRRRELLAQAGVFFRVLSSDMDEESVQADTPGQLAQILAAEKAAIVSQRHPQSFVLAADTLVVVGHEVLGKPRDREDAEAMLRKLSGITHQVITGVALLCHEKQKRLVYAVSTDVRFKILSDAEIAWYTATDEPYDKAGAYAIQGLAAHFIPNICGSYTNVVGLPICEVMESLAQVGILPAYPAQP